MTSVEKRHSGRKSGGHRKHSDGGYSDTSSSGSFLDETDREVSNLTDRAFRSLCIGDEAVYNDSDLCSSSPCTQRDKQLAFGQSGQNRERREREELKRAAHDSFSHLRVQQYEQDWVHGGMSGAEIHRDPHWEIHGEMTQGRVSATFQHSFVETAAREQSLREDRLSFLSNGATEFSSQQRRSRSRVSSLIRTFNSESQRDGAWTDGKLRERYNDNSWDKTALMNIQRGLSEFSNSCQQNFNSDHFPTADPFSSRDTNFYSSHVAAVARVNSAPSFTGASHTKHSMSTQFNCNSNFFIHSELSPFKVWRDHNRYPFQQEQVLGFSHHSEIPKWYETPMYKELSQETQPQGLYRFKERDIGHSRNNLPPVVPPSPPCSTSTTTVLQKALAVEKRCESELMGHYTHRKRTQSLGTNRLPTQRPSTASPTTEMSRRVQETISSVKALQQKIKKMTEQNMATGMTANQHQALCSEDDLISLGQNAVTWTPNVVRSNTAPVSQLLTPSGHTHQEASVVQQCTASPEPVEHPPVRAESRGATPDIRMSSYRSRATSLLFNLKDNRKRVKNTYSPTKFKNLEMLEKTRQPSAQEPKDTVIDIPDFPDPDIQFRQAASQQYVKQYQNPGLSFATQNLCPKTAHVGQYSAYSLSDYQTAEKQAEMVPHSRFTGFTPENYTASQLANGQNPHEVLLSLSSYQFGMIDNVESLRGGVYGLNTSYTPRETPKHTVNNQTSDYFRGNANAEQYFNETVEREFTKVEKYQQPKDNKHDYSNVFSQDRWRNEQDTEKLVSPWKQEINALIERDQHAQAYQRAAIIKEEHNLTRDKYRGKNLNINQDVYKLELEQSFVMGTSHKSTGSINPNISIQLLQCPPVINNDDVENKTYYGQQQPDTIRDKYVLQKYDGNNDKKETKESPLTQNYNRHTDQDYRNQHALSSNKDKTMTAQETGQRKQYMPVPEGQKMPSLQQIQATPQFEHNVEKNPLSRLENAAPPTIAMQVKDRQFAEVKAEQATTEDIKAQHTQAELAKAQNQAQVEQPKAESTRLILAAQTGSEEVKAEQARAVPSECEKVKLRQAEHFIDKKRNGEQTEQFKEKNQEQARKEETKVKTENPRNIRDGAGATHMKKEQGEHVNAEQAEVHKLKEEHIKTELNETGQARIQTAQAKREVISVEKVEEKQVRVEQMEVEYTKQNRTENTEAEQVEKEQRKDNNTNHGQIKEQKSKTAQLTMKEAEVEKVEVDQIKIEDVRVKPKEDSNQAGHVNKKQPTAQLSTIKEAKTEEKTDTGRAKPELPKTEDPHEKLVKPRPNITVIQQVKSEPDKVEQVKTELAKAKAELAKIKEKMRGEQKEKVKHSTTTDDIAKKDDPLKVNLNKPEDFEKKDQVTQTDQKRRESLVTNYDNLREKNDFTNAVSANRSKTARDESRNDGNETPTLPSLGTEIMNNNKSNDKNSPKSGLAITDTENKEEVISLKGNDVTEGHYVYSESSKEFKLFSSSYSPRNVDNKDNCDTVTDKEKNGNVEELENFETVKHTDISQQRNSDLRKHYPLERKHRSTDHNSVSGKDLHFTPPRALSLKTKQEILTSKIKAHAEKEISAIKEKGLRDGFLSKNSAKQLAASQSINIRQRPLIHEVSKKYESTVSSNNTIKHQLEPPRIHSETNKSVSPASSATTPVMSAPATGQSEDSSQKQVPKEPLKSNDNVLVPPRNTKQTGCSTTIAKLAENQDKKNQSGVQSPVQSKDQAINDNQVKQESNHEANSGKQKEESVKDNYATSSDHRNEKKNLTEATALVKVTTTEKPEIKHEDIHKGSAPTLNLVLQDQNTTGMTDDSLQIMGIMVTVRERKALEKNSEGDNSQECVNTKKKAGSNSELDKCHHSSGQVNKENESTTEGSTAKTNNRPVQEMYPTEMEDQILTETLNEQKNNALESVTEKNTNLQESSSINTRYKRETQLQKQMTEKGVPAIVSAPAKNKVLAETQPLLYRQSIIEGSMNDSSNKMTKENSAKNTTKAEEETNPQKTQTAHNQFMDKVDSTGTHFKMDSGRTDDEPTIKHDVQLPLSKEMSTFITPSKSGNTDDKSTPLLDEKRYDSTQLWSFNEAPPPHSSNENHKKCVSPKLQFKETFTQKNMDGVHIDSIAIRVVSKKDKQDIAGKHCVTVVPSDVVKATELNEVAPPRHEEKANTSSKIDRIKDLTESANSERQVKENLGVKHVLASVRKLSDSLRNSMQHNNINGNGKPETVKEMEKSVDESKIKAMEGDYFQVQGAAETHDVLHNSANNAETLDDVSKGGGLPGSKTPVSNKPYKELQYEAFVLDPLIKKTLESSQIRVQDENMEKKNWETEGKPASKQTDTPTERQNSSEKMENRKHHIVSPPSLSARESQSSRNSDQTRDNAVTEKTGVKPKLKSSTIPEISAIADYARLKVIVSEEQESTIQEFPPNKKEGFFPLIQTRHSRRPVFTLDPKEFPVKDKKMPNKTEMSAKVNKEPKALVFPITEKEHQRTGMFKLGDKERQGKMISDTQGVLDAGAKYTQCPKETMKSPTTLHKYQGCEEQVAGIDAQRLCQVDQSSLWSDNPDLQTISSSVAVNRPRNTSASQHPKSPVNFNAHEKHKQYKDDNRTPRKGEMFDEKLVEKREERKEKPSQEGLANQYEETVAKQSQKEQTSIIEEEKRAEEIRKKRIMEQSRASLAEEERRTAQREEERRAKEREAIALRIKERREKQRESDKMKENKAATKEEELRAKLRAEEIKVKETERTKAEEDRRAKLRKEEEQIKENEERRMLKQQEEERASQRKQQQRAAQEEQLRRAAQEEQLRRAAQEEKMRRATQEEQLRRAAQEEQLSRAAQEEQMRRATQEEQLSRAAQEEQLTRAALEKQKLAAHEEQQRRAAQEEQQRRAAQEEHQRRATQEEQQIRATEEEQQIRAAQEEQQRRAAQEEQHRRAAQEQQRRAAQEEQQRRAERIAAHEEQQIRAAQMEEQQRATQEEQQRRAAQEEQQRRAESIAAHEEQQRRAAQKEQQQRAAQEEQQRRAAQEEQQRRAERIAAHEEQQIRAAQMEQQQRAAQEEQQRRAAQEEQQKRAAHEEQQGRAAQEEQQRRSAQEEQQKRAAYEEQQRRAAYEKQQRRAAQEEQQRRGAQEEQQRRAALEEQQRRTVLRKQKIATQEEQQRRAAREEQQRKDAQEELQITTAQQEQQRRVTHEEQQRRVTHEEQQRRVTHEEQQKRVAKEEQQRRATVEEQQRNIVLIEEETQIKQTKKILDEIGKEAQEGKEDREAVEKEKIAAKQKVEKKAKEERTIQLVDIKVGGESQGVREWLTQKEDEIKAKMSEEDEKFATQRENERGNQMEEQRRAAQMMDALQYYAITSSESERKTKERQECSPFPSQQKHNPSERESTEDSGTYTRHYRPHGSASPAPRSNTSSPALGAKPSMFRVKDNTIRGSSLTKPVKPRFHKNFGEDFRVGSPIERVSERGEGEQEITKHGVETKFNRLAAIKEFSSSQQESSSQDYSSNQPQHRPYSRRSIALDEDDSRSVISNMSEGVESFATSATDLADVRGLYDYERPESACSYSSDVSRSMGKPPAVPPKSDKAMQRAKRLTTRRIKKELFKAGEDKHARVEKPPQELSRNPPSSSNEVHYSNRHAIASPHFSSPISLVHAPVSMHTSHTEHKSSHHSVQASPHATGASSLPITSPHVTASVTLPVASSNPTSPASNNAVFKTVPHVSSSPTLHHATHPAPVTQYHVESSYPQSYPFTQRKVLQDLSSGQYFVVDVPVQVKTKTFFDPETGKYVQLNVRESGQSTSQPQPQQTYPQPQLQSQMRVKSEHPQTQASPGGKPIMLYQGYHGYPQGYQPAAINSMPPHGSSSTTLSLHQNQQPVRENQSYGYPTSEVRGNSEGHCYSPEKTPYMDTVNDTEKTYNTIYNTHGSYEVFPECDTNSQLAGSSVCENDSSAHTRYQPRDIITMGELEDFMEVSDW